jgi:hypothetical protein
MRLQAQAFLKGNVFALVAGLIIGWLTHRAPPEPPADRLS